MAENDTTWKKSIFLQQIVMPHVCIALKDSKRVSEHVDNSELFDTLYTEFPKEFEWACCKRLIFYKLS